MRLKDKVAVITGAGGAIGGATAIRFANEGAKVIVTDINAAGGQDVVNTIKENGGEAVFVEADISKVADTEKLINAAIDSYGSIDILFNNAGTERTKSIHEYTEEDYDVVMDVHLKGAFFCIRYAIPEMLKQKSGVIINMGSMYGLSGASFVPTYCAAKGALVNLTKQIALEYAPNNIRCNCVCPAVVMTSLLEAGTKSHPEFLKSVIDSHPMGRVAEIEEVVDAVLFLSSDDAKYISGVSLPVDGACLAGKV
ncbi:MAG: glucose 1-dehydrogenase [Desulfobacterales bacterium]|jgi:NAD(P)-dependent dehydrogenase (short-subunit alcohol dehydrogenase family)|nr:glucose 1-dehydrogenase [Desulfobacteraceae bacterium]MBT7086571.1 glucose 1-dehydrogenase [Desulfobacterales bacterium]MBT7695842.1 glucose 1-dehydrogenase [Desulfobacterales bacterium]